MVALQKHLFFAFFFIISVITVLPFFNINSFFKFFKDDSFNTISSVWCLKNSNLTNICKFINVCYDTEFKTVLFFLNNKSIIKGFTHYSELQKIQVSSLHFHNQFYANLSIVDIENYKIVKALKIESKVLLFSRFKPNNIMHCIHDDLLPIYLTLEYVCLGDTKCMESYRLIIHDHYPLGPFFDLYKLFSNQFPIILNKLPSSVKQLLCFKEMLVGFVEDSIFYHYGFNRPNGPIKTPYLNQNDIVRFTSFVKQKLKINIKENFGPNIILMYRQKSRRILNIEEVKEMIKTTYEISNPKSTIKFLVLDLYSNNIINIIKAFCEANIIIGMHGAEMIFSLFMKSKSLVIELFPFGILPEIVSFVKPVSELEGSHIQYFSWRNMYKNNSVAHPNAHPLFGGINHLNQTLQEKIRSTVEVPPVKCCNNPVYLYHMYQDTWVSGDFRQFLEKSRTNYLGKKMPGVKQINKKWFYPNVVSNINCSFLATNKILLMSWFPPFNVKETNNLSYSFYLRDKKSNFVKEFLIKELNLQLNIPEVGNTPQFEAWISVHYSFDRITTTKSPDFYFECF